VARTTARGRAAEEEMVISGGGDRPALGDNIPNRGPGTLAVAFAPRYVGNPILSRGGCSTCSSRGTGGKRDAHEARATCVPTWRPRERAAPRTTPPGGGATETGGWSSGPSGKKGRFIPRARRGRKNLRGDSRGFPRSKFDQKTAPAPGLRGRGKGLSSFRADGGGLFLGPPCASCSSPSPTNHC